MSQWMFELTPLTPLHIGSGETLEPYEYVILDDKLYQFSPEQLLMKLNQKEQDEFINLVESSPAELQRFLQQRKGLVAALDPNPIPVAPDALQKYQTQLDNPKADLTLYPFIKTSRKPFIPGSSLKGAIRTALVYDRAFLKAGRRPIEERDSRRLEHRAFQYSQATEDPFKSLKIGDSQSLPGTTRLELVKVYTQARKEGQIPMLREVTQSRLSSRFEQSFLHPVQLVAEFTRYDKKLMKIEIAAVVTACRQFYTEHLKREKKYFDSANFLQTSSWYEKLIEWGENLPANSFLVRFGWGSGFDAVTVNYARANPESKRSRRLSENGLPLGWAQVQVKEC